MPEAWSEPLDEVATRSSSWCNICILMLWPTSMCKGLPVMLLLLLLGSASGGAAHATLVKMLRGMTATDVERTPTLSLPIPTLLATYGCKTIDMHSTTGAKAGQRGVVPATFTAHGGRLRIRITNRQLIKQIPTVRGSQAWPASPMIAVVRGGWTRVAI